MADEDYRWLDRDAAERLLSGESFDGADHHTRERAERLAKTLGALTADERVLAGPPGDLSAELPGEEAAMAAFREARAASAGASSTRVGAAAAAAGSGETVRIGGAPAPGRPTRWARPVRFGLAAVLAGCMIGGVAVAAGTGVLPSPFGSRDDQGPAASASPVAPPQPLESATGGASTPPDVEPDDAHTTPDGTSREPGSSAPPQSPEATGGPQDGATSQPGTGSGDTRREDEAKTWRRQVIAACRDHRDGDLKGEKKRRLEKLLGGSEGITEACDRLLGGGDRQGDGSGGNGGGEDDDGGDGGDKDDDGSSGGGNEHEGNGGNRVPPVISPTYPQTKPTPTASYSAQPQLPSSPTPTQS
ncbi:hypothetical protein ACIBKX_11850 [Streptomyces sp. NPDC050658]|uniref:hypothetical protein n=1 Tax=unclassified Streptomyces TaxID=2593676 RepID=UPI003414A65F